MRYRLLGTLEVIDDTGNKIDLGPFKQRSLFALLLLNSGQIVSTDRILEELWGEDADGKQNALWVYVSRLRSALDPERSDRSESSILARRDPGYVLDIDRSEIDVHVFEDALRAARLIAVDDPGAAVAQLDEALGLWRGEALEEFTYENFGRIEIERLNELRLEAMETLIDAKLALGEARSLISELESTVRDHPFRERPAGQLMLALYRSGRQAEALRAYERHRRVVTEELGIEPSPDLRRLEEQILLHDPSLLPAGGTMEAAAGRPERSPFKGLLAFGEEDESDFHGRDQLVADILRKLDGDQLVAVVGPSGSGKSSVVTAGVLPRVRKGAIAGSDRWLVARMVPGAHPYVELEAALLRSSLDAPDSLAAQLAEGESGIMRAVLRLLPTPESTLLLVIDQFEELFTLVDDNETQRRFLSGLLTAIDDTRGRIKLIITLRADFYDRPLLHPQFGSRMGAAVVNVTPLSAAELEEAAVRPAETAGIRLEPALLGQIIADVVDQPGGLPMFQYTLTELYERRRDEVLRLADYQAMNGVRGAITNRAEALYTELEAEGQEAARQLFLRLVALGGGDSWSRRRVRAADIISLDVDVVSLQSAIGAFGEKRLLSFDRDRATGAPTVEVGHEALLTEWERLGDWINEARKDLERHAALVVAVDEWERSEHNPDYLLSGTRLAEYESWSAKSALQLNSRELDYVGAGVARRTQEVDAEASRQVREDRLKGSARRRLWGMVAAVAVLLSIGAVWFAMTYVLTGPTVVVVFEGRYPEAAVGLLVGEGIDRAHEEARFETIEVVPPVSDLENRLREVIEDGAEIVIGVGTLEAGLVSKVVADYPHLTAVMVDFEFDGSPPSYTFAVEEGAYLAGMAAALTTRTRKVGYVGGMQFDTVENFRAGFIQGVRSVSSEIEIEEIYVSAGDFQEAFGRPDLGQRAAAELYAAGADVVFHAAGGTGVGIHEAAKEATQRTGSKHWGIGVDDDELFAVDASVRDYVLTSALKKYDTVVAQAILDAVRGEVPEAGRVLTLADGATSYSQTGDHLDPSVVEKLNAAADEIAAGTIEVNRWPDGPPDRLLGSPKLVHASATIAVNGACSYEGPLEPPAGAVLHIQLSNSSPEVGGISGLAMAFGNPTTNAMALPGSTNSVYMNLDAFSGPYEIYCGSESAGGWQKVAALAVSFDGDPDDAALLETYLRAGFAGSFDLARALATSNLRFESTALECPRDRCQPIEDYFAFKRALEATIDELNCNPIPAGAECEYSGQDLIGRQLGESEAATYTATIEEGRITRVVSRPRFSALDRYIPYLAAEHSEGLTLECSPFLLTEQCAKFMISVLDGWNG